jgi:hypothetical protein
MSVVMHGGAAHGKGRAREGSAHQGQKNDDSELQFSDASHEVVFPKAAVLPADALTYSAARVAAIVSHDVKWPNLERALGHYLCTQWKDYPR